MLQKKCTKMPFPAGEHVFSKPVNTLNSLWRCILGTNAYYMYKSLCVNSLKGVVKVFGFTRGRTETCPHGTWHIFMEERICTFNLFSTCQELDIFMQNDKKDIKYELVQKNQHLCLLSSGPEVDLSHLFPFFFHYRGSTCTRLQICYWHSWYSHMAVINRCKNVPQLI